MKYEFLDSGDQKKLERFGSYLLIRPAALALWKPQDPEKWKEADAIFSREPENQWKFLKKNLPKSWIVELFNLQFKVELTSFGHLGIFPEHAFLWEWMKKKIFISKRKVCRVLNLFAYTGGATLALAKEGVEVCHLDASFPAMEWAKENAKLNQLDSAPIRWIVDDAIKFLKRENKRGQLYDGVILDPPSFGRGRKNEVFKIEEDLFSLVELIKGVLAKEPLFVVLSSHTPGLTQTGLSNLLKQILPSGNIASDEILLKSKQGFSLPSGFYSIWESR